jgi:glycosyltransferase involved in cell wall biosynthesis
VDIWRRELEVIVGTEQRFLSHEGRVYAEGAGGYSFWLRYLEVFTIVSVVARMRAVSDLPDNVVQADGEGVRFLRLPYFKGPYEGLRKTPELVRESKTIAKLDSAFILRVPGFVGTIIYPWLRRRGWPFALEVVGDPHDSLDPNVLKVGWAKYLRPIIKGQLRKQCWKATSVAYVTASYLQNRYPTSAEFSTHYSSVELDENVFSRVSDILQAGEKERHDSSRPLCLAFVGSLSQRYKGLDVLLKALHICRQGDVEIRLSIFGDGEYRSEYEQLAIRLGLDEDVKFSGYVERGFMLEQLRSIDLYVMPSYVEGLPRALLEAMAIGLPCLASDVGGIPELLEPQFLFEKGNYLNLADLIIDLSKDPELLHNAAKINRKKAREYSSEVLAPRRRAMYKHIMKATIGAMHGASAPQ